MEDFTQKKIEISMIAKKIALIALGKGNNC